MIFLLHSFSFRPIRLSPCAVGLERTPVLPLPPGHSNLPQALVSVILDDFCAVHWRYFSPGGFPNPSKVRELRIGMFSQLHCPRYFNSQPNNSLSSTRTWSLPGYNVSPFTHLSYRAKGRWVRIWWDENLWRHSRFEWNGNEYTPWGHHEIEPMSNMIITLYWSMHITSHSPFFIRFDEE